MKKGSIIFREWAVGTVQNDGTVDGYIFSLDSDFSEILNIDTIFSISDIHELELIHQRCSINNDLQEWNRNIAHGRPSAAINKYIKFMKLNESIEH